MYALVEWIDEKKFSVIPLSRVKEPRKAFEEYAEGDLVKASCPGFSGVHNAKLVAIRGSKTEDKKTLERLAIDHVEKLQQDESTEDSALESENNSVPDDQSASTDTTDKRKKKTGTKVNQKKVRIEENKENKEQKSKKQEELKQRRTILLNKNKAFLSSLDNFRAMNSANSRTHDTSMDLDDNQVVEESSFNDQQKNFNNSNTWTNTTSTSSYSTTNPQQHTWTSNQIPTDCQQQQNTWTPHQPATNYQHWTNNLTSNYPQINTYYNTAASSINQQYNRWTPHQPASNYTQQTQWNNNHTPSDHQVNTYTPIQTSSHQQNTLTPQTLSGHSQHHSSFTDDNPVRRRIFSASENLACQDCVTLKEELEKAYETIRTMKEELDAKAGNSTYIRQKDGRPRAGVLPPEVANANHMVELMPGSKVFIYPKDLKIASQKDSGCAKARYLLSAFYANEELVEAGNLHGANSKKGLNQMVLQAILDYAVIKGGREKLSDIKIALRSKMSALVCASRKKIEETTHL